MEKSSIMLQPLAKLAALLDIQRRFKQDKIQFLEMKGLTLSLFLYNNVWQRQCRDIDILIKRNDVKKSLEILQNAGFTRCPPDDAPHLEDCLNFVLKTQKDIALKDPKTGTIIELHWQLTDYPNAFKYTETEIWPNTQTITHQNQTLKILPPTLWFLYIIYHGSYSCWSKPKWLNDVKQFAEKHPELLSQKTYQEATNRNIEIPYLEAITLLKTTYGSNTPKIKPTRQAKIKRNIALKLIQYVRQNPNKKSIPGRLLRIAHTLTILSDWPTKIHYLYHSTFGSPRKTWHCIRLPKKLFWLYPIIHPLLWPLHTTKWLREKRTPPKSINKDAHQAT